MTSMRKEQSRATGGKVDGGIGWQMNAWLRGKRKGSRGRKRKGLGMRSIMTDPGAFVLLELQATKNGETLGVLDMQDRGLYIT